MKFRHRVVEVRWSEAEAGWHVKVENLADGTILNDFCNVLINGNGLLKYVIYSFIFQHLLLVLFVLISSTTVPEKRSGSQINEKHLLYQD
jgi:hypothetical protein